MVKWIFGLLISAASSPLLAQKISYQVSFPNATHHEARIQIDVAGTTQPVLLFRMSRSSPGRYATHEFGKNVYDVIATDAYGKALPVIKTDGDVWQVSGNKSGVKLTYTLYGNYADGTYAGIDASSIHLNMPAAFMWVKGLETAPIQISFEVPDTAFTIATQLKPAAAKNTFTAPNLQYFMDSPTKIGRLQWRQWPISNTTSAMTIRLALEADVTGSQTDSLSERVQRITRQAKAVFGEYPAYDYGTYTFLTSLNRYVYGDGMEHRNSTMITGGRRFSLQPSALEVFAHEFFHCWNVERIRPKTLEPFNFEKSNMSNELWCAEGFTQYYGGLLMVRAGLQSDTAYGDDLAGLVNAKLNTPGADKYTPIQASNMAVFTDAGVAVDKTNYQNIFTSYYTYGGSLALALDMMLRQQGKTLDDFMRQMWKVHGKTEKPYTVGDMQTALAAVTNTSFAKSFFDTYVYAPGKPDYESLLAQAGFAVKKAAPGKVWLGRVQYTEVGGLTIASNTVKGTPLYEAGLDVGDVIVSIGGEAVKKEADLFALLGNHQPGENLTIVYNHRGKEMQGTIKTIENSWLTVIPYEQTGQVLTDKMKTFRAAWLGAK